MSLYPDRPLTFDLTFVGSLGEPELFQRSFVCCVYYVGHASPGPDRAVQRPPGPIQAGRLPTAKENGYVFLLRPTKQSILVLDNFIAPCSVRHVSAFKHIDYKT